MNAKTKKLIDFAKKQGVVKPFWSTYLFGVRLELNVLPSKITDGERIYALVPCKFKGKQALAIVTSIRVIVLNQGLFGRFSNNSRDDVYYTQSSGGNPSGGYFSSYSIQVPGAENEWKITGLWGKDADTLDKAFNKARQSYEAHIYEHKRDAERETNLNQTINSDLYSSKLTRLKNMLDSGEISYDEFNVLKEEL